MFDLQRIRRVLAGVIGVLGLVIALLFKFDPVHAVWVGWFDVSLALIEFGLFLHGHLSKYRTAVWLALGLTSVLAFLYAGDLADRLGCPSIEYHGKLLASALPSPPNVCLKMKEVMMNEAPAETIKPFPPNTVFLFMGSDVGYIFSLGRWPIITNNGQVLLSADFNENGLSVSSEIYNDQGVLQATVKDNDVDALSRDICVDRPDLSTLIITDRETKQERLYVHYLNRQAVVFRGLLHYPNLPSVEITKDKLQIEGMSTFADSCEYASSRVGMIDVQTTSR